MPGKPVNHELGHVGDDGEPAGHVAIQRAIADGDFRFVAGAEDHGAEFIRKSHQIVATDARLDVFFGCVRGTIAKHRFERLDVGVEYGTDGDGKQFDAEIVGQALCVGLAAFRGVGAGHGDAEDVFLAERVNGDGGDNGGVHSPAEADDGFLEIAFADVVACAGNERMVSVGDFFLSLRVNVAFSGDRVEEYEIFLKGFGLRGDVAVGRKGHAGAIEDQRIIPANLVDVDDRAVVLLGDGAEHFDAQRALINGVRRSGDVEKDASSLLDKFGDGVAGVARLGPEIFVVPNVAADAEFGEDGKFSAAALGLFREVENAGGVAFKVADSGIELSEGYLHSG